MLVYECICVSGANILHLTMRFGGHLDITMDTAAAYTTSLISGQD